MRHWRILMIVYCCIGTIFYVNAMELIISEDGSSTEKNGNTLHSNDIAFTEEHRDFIRPMFNPANAKNNWISFNHDVLLGISQRYERMFGPKISLGARVYYGFLLSLLEEEGEGIYGIDICFRFYPGGRIFFIGTSLGYFYCDYNSSNSFYKGAVITPEIGWKMNFVNAGQFFIQYGVALTLPLGKIQNPYYDYNWTTNEWVHKNSYSILPVGIFFFGIGFSF